MKAEHFSREDRKRFWDKVDKESHEGGCWLWTASLNKDGYGNFKANGQCQHAHRVAYVLRHGWIGRGVCVLHWCDTPGYVNPDHLRQGTHVDNVADRVAKGRSARGEKHGRAKLTELQVVDIRVAAEKGKSFGALAREYGVDRKLISSIVKGKIWKDAGGPVQVRSKSIQAA